MSAGNGAIAPVYTGDTTTSSFTPTFQVTEEDSVRQPYDGGAEGERIVEDLDRGALWSRFHARLLILGMRRLGSRADAEDMAQDALQRVTKALDEKRLREPGALPAFVYQTALHVCQQSLRKRYREQRALEGYARSSVEEDGAGHALTNLIDEERRRVVRLALQSLRRDDRELLEQLYARDADPEELAERLGISAGALRVRKHRALQRLSAALGEKVTE
jgi:RNA polymerase sigma-70 factor (ECF subfamily)